MSATERADDQTHAVDPSRLASGAWCHRAQKTIGEGDIRASYSADRIGMGQPVRKPFSWRGGLWVCVGTSYRGQATIAAKAYRLLHLAAFDGETMTYAQRTANADAARADKRGFYHGMSVTHAGAALVLCGPPATFVPGKTEQLTLF